MDFEITGSAAEKPVILEVRAVFGESSRPILRGAQERAPTGGRNCIPEVIAAYQRALKLHNDLKHNDPANLEHSREYYDACGELERLLGPWLGGTGSRHHRQR